MRVSAVYAAAAAATFASAPAFATWSIVLIDTRTGEVAVASATCLTGFDLRANTPVLIPGVGAATAQSFVDTTGQNRVFIRDRLALGVSPQDIITQLSTFDSGHQSRQYGIADVYGRTATFSGTGAGAWAGGQTGLFNSTHNGRIGRIAYAIQGNVLTGSPVVEQAVIAAISTPGDLPAKLMASMQAARLMGGDGRCSCNAAAPTSCGSPPASFTKSAHIAYMLIARAGDTEGANGIYRTGGTPQGLVIADINSDQRPDLLTANFTGTASVITNLSSIVTPPLAPVFTPLPINYSLFTGPRCLTVAELTGDAFPDLVAVASSANTATLFRGSATGAFTQFGLLTTGGTTRQIIAADLDGANGLDLAAANSTSSTISLFFNNGTGAFTAAPSPVVDTGPVDLVAANFVGSPAIDLAVISRNANHLTILRNNGDGTFSLDQILNTSTGPTALFAADLDGDSDIDIAVSCDTSSVVQVFRNEGAAFNPVNYSLPFPPADIAVGDVNGDKRPDLVAAGGNSFATLFNNAAPAGFTLDRTYTAAGTFVSLALSDLDSDGDLDLGLTSSNAGGVVTVKNLGPGPQLGKFNDGLGCATGDYFMNFNVALQQAGDPDPVLTLQTRFDQWRAALTGRPDAVQSIATIYPPHLPSVGSPAATLTISLRDWHNDPVTMTLPSITVTQVPVPGSPGTAGPLTIGPVDPQGGGVFRVTLTGGPTPGLARLRVRIDDGTRPVTIMPDPALSIYAGTCYPNCDASTLAPILTANDFACFINKYVASEPYANCDGTTTTPTLTAADFMCFINQFAAGCS